MKCLWLLLITVLPAAGQSHIPTKYRPVAFKVEPNIEYMDNIHFETAKLNSEFVLEDSDALKCRIDLLNDSIMTVSQLIDNKWQLLDRQWYDQWQWHVFENYLYGTFWLFDFNRDGYEDLVCRTLSNVHMNQWTVIYLYDPKQNRLVKLMNTADDTDVWDDPKYDKRKKIISCELYDGAYGYTSVSSFKLEGLETIPLYKTDTDMSNTDYFIKKDYRGENGKWKLINERKVE